MSSATLSLLLLLILCCFFSYTLFITYISFFSYIPPTLYLAGSGNRKWTKPRDNKQKQLRGIIYLIYFHKVECDE